MDGVLFEDMLQGRRLDVYDDVFKGAVALYTGDACVVADVLRWRTSVVGRMWIIGWFLYMYGREPSVWQSVLVPTGASGTAGGGRRSAFTDYYLDHILETMQGALLVRCDVWESMTWLHARMEAAADGAHQDAAGAAMDTTDHEVLVARGVGDGDDGVFGGGEARGGVDAKGDGVVEDV
jgi:hypothetical protein